MSAVQGASVAGNYAISVMKLQQDEAKQAGDAEVKLIDGASHVPQAPHGGNEMGVGEMLDVTG